MGDLACSVVQDDVMARVRVVVLSAGVALT